MGHEVTCIVKDDESAYNDCRCITWLGVTIDGGTRHQRVGYVHDRIKAGEAYYVRHEGDRTYLTAATRGDLTYVRTAPNDTEADNLLALPECHPET